MEPEREAKKIIKRELIFSICIRRCSTQRGQYARAVLFPAHSVAQTEATRSGTSHFISGTRVTEDVQGFHLMMQYFCSLLRHRSGPCNKRGKRNVLLHDMLIFRAPALRPLFSPCSGNRWGSRQLTSVSDRRQRVERNPNTTDRKESSIHGDNERAK